MQTRALQSFKLLPMVLPGHVLALYISSQANLLMSLCENMTLATRVMHPQLHVSNP